MPLYHNNSDYSVQQLRFGYQQQAFAFHLFSHFISPCPTYSFSYRIFTDATLAANDDGLSVITVAIRIGSVVLFYFTVVFFFKFNLILLWAFKADEKEVAIIRIVFTRNMKKEPNKSLDILFAGF